VTVVVRLRPKAEKTDELWEIWLSKDGHGFTAHPASDQCPASFPSLETPQKMREWMAAHGYERYDDDPDHWKTK